MSLPKGINTPEVREPWIAQRRAKLDQFDRLVGKGLCESKAARELGIYPSGIRALRRSIEQMEAGRHYGRSGGHASRIDLGLSLLSVLRKPAETLSCEDIAAWCDCSRSHIQRIEQRALKKVRMRLLASLRAPEEREELETLLGAFQKAA